MIVQDNSVVYLGGTGQGLAGQHAQLPLPHVIRRLYQLYDSRFGGRVLDGCGRVLDGCC